MNSLTFRRWLVTAAWVMVWAAVMAAPYPVQAGLWSPPFWVSFLILLVPGMVVHYKYWCAHSWDEARDNQSLFFFMLGVKLDAWLDMTLVTAGWFTVFSLLDAPTRVVAAASGFLPIAQEIGDWSSVVVALIRLRSTTLPMSILTTLSLPCRGLVDPPHPCPASDESK